MHDWFVHCACTYCGACIGVYEVGVCFLLITIWSVSLFSVGQTDRLPPYKKSRCARGNKVYFLCGVRVQGGTWCVGGGRDGCVVHLVCTRMVDNWVVHNFNVGHHD